jgi:hypothetical protein
MIRMALAAIESKATLSSASESEGVVFRGAIAAAQLPMQKTIGDEGRGGSQARSQWRLFTGQQCGHAIRPQIRRSKLARNPSRLGAPEGLKAARRNKRATPRHRTPDEFGFRAVGSSPTEQDRRCARSPDGRALNPPALRTGRWFRAFRWWRRPRQFGFFRSGLA